jgi:Zn-dependent oligopeptidase
MSGLPVELQQRAIVELLSEVSALKAENAKLTADNACVPALDKLWPQTTQQIEANTEAILKQTKENLDRVAAIPDADLTFDNCVEPLMAPPNYKTNPLLAATKFLQHCSTREPIREAAEKAGVKFASARVACRMREDVYKKVATFSETPAAAALSTYDKHFLNAVLDDFRRGGLALPQAQRDELTKVMEDDASICSQYGTNIGSDKTEMFFDECELSGLPEDYAVERKVEGREDGKTVRVSLKYPDIIPIMSRCTNAATRRKVTLARESAYGNNLDLVATGVEYRVKIAALLGYKSYADFVTESRMTGSEKAICDFLSDTGTKLRPSAQKELARLVALKKVVLAEQAAAGTSPSSTEGLSDDKIDSWDLSFYHNILLVREYGVDEEAIRQYFPLPIVVEQTLMIYQELLGLNFTEIFTHWKWHEGVRCFIVRDTASNDLVGHFYLDMHPREGKYSHAAIFHLVKRNDKQGIAPVDCMLCNLPAPAADGSPALLRHDDVVTFFHEFGHIMHGLCAVGHANSTRLAKCPRDFVEAPSQMLENWCWQEEVLQRLSSHKVTGKPLPKDLLQKLLDAKNVNVAIFTSRQVYLASLDMALHGSAPPLGGAESIQALVDKLRPEISLIENPPGCNMLRSFGHVMKQYAAAYNGYLWSEVLSADMFHHRFAKDGIFNRKTGMDYRKCVLAPGGVGSIMEHLTKFLGRAPENEHFLRSRGLIE